MKKQVSIKRKAKPIKSRHAGLVAKIKHLVEGARQSIVQKINTELLITYWNVGKLIVLEEEQDNIEEKSSRQLILELSRELTFHVGKGFSRSNLFAMRRFYQLYKTVQTVSGQITSMRKKKIKQDFKILALLT